MDTFRPGRHPLVLFGGTMTENRLVRIVPSQRVCVDIPIPDSISGGATGQLETFFAPTEGELGLMPLDGIPDGAREAVGAQSRLDPIILGSMPEGPFGNGFVVQPRQDD